VDVNIIPDQLKKLEDKVEQLVQKCKELQNAKASLEEKANHLEKALSQKDMTEKRFLEEKSLIRSKMDDLVGRLDQVLEST
jgi:peptidoglycan hydrolase CwlO-like protein